MMEMTMPHDPFAQFVSYLLGDLSPPKPKQTRRYVDGQLVQGVDATRKNILNVIRICGSVCRQDIVKMSRYPKTTVYKVLDEMEREGVVLVELRQDLTTKGRAIKHYSVLYVRRKK